MSVIIEPKDVIVPIIALDESGKVRHFLGTGSFVEKEQFLLTAHHVVRDWPGRLAIVTLKDLTTFHTAKVVATDEPHDLALLKVDGYTPPRCLPLALDEPLHSNHFVVTLEYGTTITAGRNIVLSPATRLGNVTRVLNLTDRLGPAGDRAYELSFPALRGASGAPVLSNDTEFKLYGVIVANVSYHLLPAQIESVLDQSSQIVEETHFMLPQAIAVNVIHARPLIEAARAQSA